MSEERKADSDNITSIFPKEKKPGSGEIVQLNKLIKERLSEEYIKGRDEGVKYGKEEVLDFLIVKIDGFLSGNITEAEAAAYCKVMQTIKLIQKEMEEN